MMQSSKELAQTPTSAMACSNEKYSPAPKPPPAPQAPLCNKQHCDILLANFQIKKKRYRVLLNYDHIVWERLDAKQRASVHGAEANTKKEAEFEAEQLAHRATYGNNSRVLHVNELIRVSKGNSKSAALQLVPPAQSHTQFGAPSVAEQPAAAGNSPPTEQYLAISYAERIVHSPTDCNRWRVRKLVLYNVDPYVVRQWHALLNDVLESAAPTRLRVRRLLVFINPYGGRKQGLHVYERHCKPLFQLAGIDASCIISQRSNQIRDMLYSHDLTPFDAVCCVGGDGTVAEVINGLIFRAIRDAGLDARRPEYVPKPALPIAIIPAGSTDTVAYSLHGTADVRTAAIHLILGQRRGVDICSVRNRDGIIRFCASVLSYGYLGDVAAKSEKYRWMGTKRYEFAGVKTFLLNHGYDAELRLLQSAGAEAETASASSNSNSSMETSSGTEKICCVNCVRCNAAAVTDAELTAKLALANSEAITGPANVNNGEDESPTPSKLLVAKEEKNKYTALGSHTHTNSTEGELSSSKSETVHFDSIRNTKTTDCDRNSKAVITTDQMVEEEQKKHIQHLQPTDTNAANAEVDRSRVTATTDTSSLATIPHETNSLQHVTNSNNNNKVSTNIDATVDGVSEVSWKTVNGKFFMISGANITCACSRSPNGISRYAHLGDGYLDLVLVRKTSLLNNVRLLLNTVGRNGDIRNLPFVEVHRTKKFCFRSPFGSVDDEYSMRGSCQPITASAQDDIDNESNGCISRWNCDGEVVSDQELTMSSHCQLIDVFMRGPHTYSKPIKSDKSSVFCCCNCCSSSN